MVKKSYKKSCKEIFQEHINNEEGYKEIEDLYNYIKQEYIYKIKSGKVDINIEKARLDGDINQGKITSVPNYMQQYDIPILRIKTNESGEESKFPQKLIEILKLEH